MKKWTIYKDKNGARRLRTAKYYVIEDKLYCHVLSASYLKCLGSDNADYVVKEIHHGIYDNHSIVKSIIYKALRVGYYHPTM